VVLDNACGSGSFLVAAIQEGRNVLGIERNLATAQFQKTDIHLIDVCEQRMQDAWQGLTPKTRRHLTASGLFRTTA
jgi:site-specific DNA-methyltransferase (adenine-specific)/modification methylase